MAGRKSHSYTHWRAAASRRGTDRVTRAWATLPDASITISSQTVPSIFLMKASLGYRGSVTLIRTGGES